MERHESTHRGFLNLNIFLFHLPTQPRALPRTPGVELITMIYLFLQSLWARQGYTSLASAVNGIADETRTPRHFAEIGISDSPPWFDPAQGGQ